MEKNCSTCRWFDPTFAPDDDPDDALGLCEWPAENLPYSLRYGNRERTAVGPKDGADCSCHKPASDYIDEIAREIGAVMSHPEGVSDLLIATTVVEYVGRGKPVYVAKAIGKAFQGTGLLSNADIARVALNAVRETAW